jgi:hypothetical protein
MKIAVSSEANSAYKIGRGAAFVDHAYSSGQVFLIAN